MHEMRSQVGLTATETPRRGRSHAETCEPPVAPTKPRWKGDTLFKPETPRQARTHDTYATRYRSIGLCDHCAAQAALGHQHGFTVVEPVGDCCLGIVAQLPKAEHCCWRSMNASNSRTVEEIRLSLGVTRGEATRLEPGQSDASDRLCTAGEAA